MKTITVYPGCSLKGTGWPYERSLAVVARALGHETKELDGWTCCGATFYMSVDEMQSFALAALNLKRAEELGEPELMVPCPSCFLVLNKTQRSLMQYPEVRKRVRNALQAAGKDLPTRFPHMVHPLEWLVREVGLDVIRAHVKRPLRGFHIAPYYGCQLVRPWPLIHDDPFQPTQLDELLRALGAEVVEYPAKTRCCGGSLPGTIPEAGTRLVAILLHEAHRRGANLIATICPLCQFNLESYQGEACPMCKDRPVPVLYFTQIIGLAFGYDESELGLDHMLISIRNLLKLQEVRA